MKKPDILQDATEISPLINLLGESRIETIKDRIADLIIQKVQNDIRDWQRYLFYPPDHEWIVEEAYETVSKKIKKMYTDAALEVAQRSVEAFKQAALKGGDT